MYDDSPWSTILNIIGLGAMYCVGKNVGERRTTQIYEDQNRDREIMRLRQELEALKNAPKQIS